MCRPLTVPRTCLRMAGQALSLNMNLYVFLNLLISTKKWEESEKVPLSMCRVHFFLGPDIIAKSGTFKEGGSAVICTTCFLAWALDCPLWELDPVGSHCGCWIKASLMSQWFFKCFSCFLVGLHRGGYWLRVQVKNDLLDWCCGTNHQPSESRTGCRAGDHHQLRWVMHILDYKNYYWSYNVGLWRTPRDGTGVSIQEGIFLRLDTATEYHTVLAPVAVTSHDVVITLLGSP